MSALRRLADIKFGKTLGAGAFGTVKAATINLDGQMHQVAVKTLLFANSDDAEEKLEEFCTEATIGWELSKQSRESVSNLQNLAPDRQSSH